MTAALKKESLYDLIFPPDRPRSVSIVLAIPLAGGMYYCGMTVCFIGAQPLCLPFGVLP
jgi:hypothetical protein